jgi:hypothetical protein
VPQTRDALAKLLVELGVSILKTLCQPEVLTVYRLAIAESDRAPRLLEHSIAAAMRLTKKHSPNFSEKLKWRGWSKPVIRPFWQPVISPCSAKIS